MTSTVYKIPLTPAPQAFSIAMGNAIYNMKILWNTVAQAWMLDIDDISNNPILQGVPLVTNADLFEQYGYLNFGGALYAQTDNAPGVIPSYNNLGIDSHLYFVVP